ncbi:MAG TPA: enoyl-CoA hydratase/isomerase family protein [Methylomirabilota bacterium]|nr:enoyl-CoA hydratase/isomerase family protein [Methylomirabilota bacterium]
MAGRPRLLVEDRDGVRALVINRPERSNALTVALASELGAALEAADADPGVRLVTITGAGERAFSAGADLEEMAAGADRGERFRPVLPSLYSTVLGMRKPTLAAINGSAVGGGLELALACDLRVASAAARFGLPEIGLGMGATFGTVMLTRLLPLPRALELVFTGELIEAEEAARWGLVRVVPAERLRAAAWALAARVAAAAPLAVEKMKAVARLGAHLPVAEAVRLQVGPDLYSSEDRLEGLRAWREKRRPVWRGR